MQLLRRLILGSVFIASISAAVAASDYWAYIGTYTGAKSKGVYAARYDARTGKLGEPRVAAETANPTFLAVHPNRKFLYAINEVARGPKKAGSIVAYEIDAASGSLRRLNEQSTGGAGPCHVYVDASGKCVLAANYSGGSVCALPINKDGSLGESGTFIQHEGSSANKQRQEGPHGHCIITDPANRFALACDLGLDKVLIYQLDAARARLTPNDPPAAMTRVGAGPRHIAFHPNKKFAYVINELDCTMTAFRWDGKKGALETIGSVSTLPGEVQKGYSTAEVAVHPSGQFVYGSNRGHDTMAVFACDQKTGQLTLIQNESTQGKMPRHFAIDPAGKFLFAENQDSHTIVGFSIDATTGKLTPTGQTIEVGSPVCMVFVPAK